jgi:endonuclease/exonuclease/phosphatase family metal-dependent hydrolase
VKKGLRGIAERKGKALQRVARRRSRPSLATEIGTFEETGPSLVVATYNVHTCVGTDRRYDPARIAAVLCELGADIISLQEVVGHREGANFPDQGSFLAQETGLRAISLPPRADHRSRFGNAILTHLPVLAVRHIDLSVDGYAPRGALDVDLDAGRHRLRVVATHFGLRGGERRAQAQRLLGALTGLDAGNGAIPAVDGATAILMMGDLNEWRGRHGGIRALDRELGYAPAPRTFPSWCPILPLDRIYAAPPALLRDFDVHRSSLARLASDHLPLRARLAWRPA